MTLERKEYKFIVTSNVKYGSILDTDMKNNTYVRIDKLLLIYLYMYNVKIPLITNVIINIIANGRAMLKSRRPNPNSRFSGGGGQYSAPVLVSTASSSQT